jgi:hypothetical protein
MGEPPLLFNAPEESTFVEKVAIPVEAAAARAHGKHMIEGVAEVEASRATASRATVVEDAIAISGLYSISPESVTEHNAEVNSCSNLKQQLPEEGSKAAFLWEVLLQKTDPKEDYGFIQVGEPRDRKTPKGWPECLIVGSIVKDGLLDAWNRVHPDAEVKPGDRILKVDTCQTVKQMQKALLQDQVTLTICRFPEPLEVVVRKEGRKLGLKSTKHNPFSLRVLEIEPKGCVAELNKMELDATNWHRVVRPGMFIYAANDASWDAEAIEHELHAAEVVTLHLKRAETGTGMKPSAVGVAPSSSSGSQAPLVSDAIPRKPSKESPFSSVVANEESKQEPTTFTPQDYQIMHKTGAQVRAGQDISSKAVKKLPTGSTVTVVEIRERRAHIVKPVDGWVSTYTKEGQEILRPLGDPVAPSEPGKS